MQPGPSRKRSDNCQSWAHGKMHRFDLGYMLGQLRGAIIGTLLVVLVWERHAASVGVFSLHHVCHPMDS